MKYRILIFLIILISLSKNGFTQPVFSFGPELGLSFTSKQGKTSPLVSPLIGITGRLKITSYFQVTSGIQYETIGIKKDLIYPYDVKIHKLCIPFEIGISIGKSKIRPAVFIGYRQNLLLSGRWSDWNSNPNFWISDTPKRFSNQFIIGLSIYLGKHLGFSFAYNKGHTIDFIYIRNSVIYIGDSLMDNEFALSTSYFLKLRK